MNLSTPYFSSYGINTLLWSTGLKTCFPLRYYNYVPYKNPLLNETWDNYYFLVSSVYFLCYTVASSGRQFTGTLYIGSLYLIYIFFSH